MPAAVAFGSGHDVGERNKIEHAFVVDEEDEANLLMSKVLRRKFDASDNDSFNIAVNCIQDDQEASCSRGRLFTPI